MINNDNDATMIGGNIDENTQLRMPSSSAKIDTVAAASKANKVHANAAVASAGALLIGGVAAYFVSDAMADNSESEQHRIKPYAEAKAEADAADKESGILAGAMHGAAVEAEMPHASEAEEVSVEVSEDEGHPILDIVKGMQDTVSNYSPQPQVDAHTPAWSDGNVACASGVNDDMSFSQAFAAARAEVGPGGAFEWRGGIYGTYTADEWNAMSASARADYASHFNWNNIDHTQSDVATYTPQASDTAQVPDSGGGIDVTDEVIGSTATDNTDDASLQLVDDDSEVEVLGVAYDDTLDATVAGLRMDGQDVFLIDVDNDSVFDVAVTDADNDGQFSPDEIADISDVGLSVDDFNAANSDMTADIAGSDDYINDAPIYDI